MTDEFDRAQDLEMAERNAMVDKVRKNNATVTYSHCQDCGDEIPQARRQVKGVTRCVRCQKEFEARQARGLK